MTLYIGLMSGTSMDGIDAAIVDIETQRLLGGITRPYDPDIYAQLVQISTGDSVKPGALWQLHTCIGRQFAGAVHALLEHLAIPARDIRAIGSHGQTILHEPNASIPYTIQLGCPHSIAALTNIPVVADFRTRDLVVGGQGAPFAPIYHQALWQEQYDNLAVVNIGGIANVSLMGQHMPTVGYDVGPGNCLMDAWIHLKEGQAYDQEGLYAASGFVIPELLQALLADPYFAQPSPKSICKSYFSLAWLTPFLRSDYAPEDVQATLLSLTATAIATASKNFQRLVVCGGGAHNQALLRKLETLLPEVLISSTKALGIDPDFLEAMMFAWLAHQTLTGTPLDMRQITGAQKPVILGAIYPV